MRYWLDSVSVGFETAPDGVAQAPLFGAERGCEHFEQRLLHVAGGPAEQRNDDCDEVLYVLSGAGSATIEGSHHGLAPGAALFVARGTPWSVSSSEGVRLLSVLVRSPLEAGATHAVLSGSERAGATAGRQFTLLATPEHGCASATQFVGFIPPGRAPDHFHRYDEVVYVLTGEGMLHIPPDASAAGDAESAPLHPGACVHLPATLVHCLENTGADEMAVLGVFRPAGSPAAAYYPDGTLAVVPGSED